jgi:Uma2 family endonuclease
MSVLTETITTSVAPPLTETPDTYFRLSVNQYHQMLDAGIFDEDDPVELLEGLLVTKMPKYPPHRISTELIRDLLPRRLPDGWFVDSQEPITLETSEPEPDAMIVRGERRQYLDRHPGPQDVAVVIEVADSSLLRDRTWKKRIYAAAGIPAYWIVNLPERRLEVYTEPSGPAAQPEYRLRQDYGLADEITLVIEGNEVARLTLTELLP